MLARRIDRALRACANPTRAVGEKAYLESDLVHFGVPIPIIRGELKRVAIADRAELRAVVQALWVRRIHELRAAARASGVTMREVVKYLSPAQRTKLSAGS